MNRRGFLAGLAALVPGLAVVGKVEAEEPKCSCGKLKAEDIEVTIQIIPNCSWWPHHPEVVKAVWVPNSTSTG